MKLQEAIDFAAKKKAEDSKWMTTIISRLMPTYLVQLSDDGKYEFFPDTFGSGLYCMPPSMYAKIAKYRRDLTDEELNGDSFDVKVEDIDDF